MYVQTKGFRNSGTICNILGHLVNLFSNCNTQVNEVGNILIRFSR